MSPSDALLIALIGFVASFYGVVAGGGGLLVIPGLIFAGLSAPAAVASSRLGVLGLSMAGAYRYRQAGLIRVGAGLPMMATVTAGSALGAFALLRVDAGAFQRAFGVAIILIAPLILLGRRLRLERPEVAPSPARHLAGHLFAFVIGIYAGLFGAGWATFFTYLMVTVFGVSFLQGAAMRTFVGLAVGVVTTVILGLGGAIEVGPAAVIFVSMLAGSYLGASFSLRQGDRYARWLVVVISIVAGAKLVV